MYVKRYIEIGDSLLHGNFPKIYFEFFFRINKKLFFYIMTSRRTLSDGAENRDFVDEAQKPLAEEIRSPIIWYCWKEIAIFCRQLS